ncbi:hypothetical protein H4R21_004749, partial [Coemansia helicoidea]
MMDSVRRGNRGSGEVPGGAGLHAAVRSVHSNVSERSSKRSSFQVGDADRTSRRYSVTALYSIVAERDEEVSDELSE